MLESMKTIQAKNEFSVQVSDPDWPDKWVKHISAHTRRVEFDLLTRVVTLHVNQLRSGLVEEIVMRLTTGTDEERRVTALRVIPSKTGAFEYVFTDGTIIDHYCDYDVVSKDPVVHRITVGFDKVRLPRENA